MITVILIRSNDILNQLIYLNLTNNIIGRGEMMIELGDMVLRVSGTIIRRKKLNEIKRKRKENG